MAHRSKCIRAWSQHDVSTVIDTTDTSALAELTTARRKNAQTKERAVEYRAAHKVRSQPGYADLLAPPDPFKE